MEAVINRISDLLQKQIGLNIASIGRSAVEYAVRTRMSSVGISRHEDYWDLLDSTDELQALIEVVVVPETWFFRHKEAFEAMTDFVMTEWLPRNPVGKLRILSVPCSTGEEPYSIAMSLLDAGFATERLTIHAIDISDRVIQHAQAGLYRAYSFRNEDLGFRDRYFTLEDNNYRLSRVVRALVQFQQKNILSLHCILSSQKYDVIFCRNVLIYLDRIGQEAVVTSLGQCLSEGGRLFSSPAEHGLFKNNRFSSIGPVGSSAFTKAKVGEAPPPSAASIYPKPLLPIPKAKVATAKTVVTGKLGLSLPSASLVAAPPALPIRSVAQRSVVEPVKAEIDTLDQVAALADAGRLDEAATLCERHVQTMGHSARSFYLQALLKDVAGDQEEAEKLYRKALYMNPNYVEALLHLASLRAIVNDDIQSRQLRERARRIQQREDL